MLPPLKALLSQFFMPDGGGAVDDTRSLQLSTAVLLVEVMRADTHLTDTERSIICQVLRSKFIL